MKSIREIYKIGKGPSSSHTMGPERAAKLFKEKNPVADAFKVVLYGSLSATGVGHGTDRVLREVLAPVETEIVFSKEELSGCHPTYIGQVERGEKNATLESIEKIASALNIPLAQLFEKLGDGETSDSIPLKCYEFLSAKTKTEQEQLYRLLVEMDKYKNK